MATMTIALGCDHAGFPLKQPIIQFLKTKGYEILDFGTNSPDSVDYPDFAHPAALAVESGKAAFGVLMCGSGTGVAVTANKHQGIRCALCWKTDIAALARQHNNANMIAFPARFISKRLALKMLGVFLNTEFEGGRHATRVNKMTC
jgi:ribose 5-phosphate isomerase B